MRNLQSCNEELIELRDSLSKGSADATHVVMAAASLINRKKSDEEIKENQPKLALGGMKRF